MFHKSVLKLDAIQVLILINRKTQDVHYIIEDGATPFTYLFIKDGTTIDIFLFNQANGGFKIELKLCAVVLRSKWQYGKVNIHFAEQSFSNNNLKGNIFLKGVSTVLAHSFGKPNN